MRVLILQQPSSSATLDRWWAEADPAAELCIVTGVEAQRPHDLRPRTAWTTTEDYAAAAGTRTLFAQCAAWRPDVIVANAEGDVLRAAEARTLYGIPGMTPAVARQFRDKVEMKGLFAAAGLPAVPHVHAASAADLLDAVEAHGPIVVKPRDAAGAVGVQVLADADAVRAACAADPALLLAVEQERCIVEHYMPGVVLHADAAVLGREVLLCSASRYVTPLHLYAVYDTVSLMLDEDDPDARALRSAVERLVRALPDGHGAAVVHLEAYRTPTGEVVMGEVACRLGGGRIRDAVIRAYDFNLSHWAYCRGVLADAPAEPARRRRQVGWILWTASEPPADGAPLPPWVVDLRRHRGAGGAANSADARASCLVDGASHAQLRRRVDEILAGQDRQDAAGGTRRAAER